MPDYEKEISRQPSHDFRPVERQELRHGLELGRARRRLRDAIRRWALWIVGIGITGAVGITQLWDKWWMRP